ncbi:MAG: RNA methyltransferase [Ruminococcaceae bacterium]|nr:RNA methyltransferase [Oscillospiraceae bacterium]
MQYLNISAKDNPRIKRVIKLQKSGHYRREEGFFVLEGLRTVDDAADNGILIEELYFTNDIIEKHPSYIKKFAQNSNFCAIISETVAKNISDTTSTQGVFAVAQFPKNKAQIESGKKYIALENLQDPSNLGAVARTAEALGIDAIIISGNSCDPFSPKSIRASMGTLLRVPLIFADNMAEFIGKLDMPTFACVVQSDAEKLSDMDFSGGAVCVIGNEANGLTDETVEKCRKRITIPMKGKAESLNAAAAAAIVMWEMVK